MLSGTASTTGMIVSGMNLQKDPLAQIKAGNNWYVDNQFENQLGTYSFRLLIENRWRVFASFIEVWRAKNNIKKSDAIVILDAGCGDGINLYGLGNIAEAKNLLFRLTGTDYNPVRVNRAAKLKGVQEIVQASLLEMPFENSRFDIILCNHVLEHIPEDGKAVAELHRVLKKGGMLILGVPNEGCFLAQVRNRIVQPSIASTTDHVNFYTEARLVPLLTQAGFEVSRVERESFFFPHTMLNAFLGATDWGQKIIMYFKRTFPGQSAGLIVMCSK
jgi:SAM-dependent methyltransferase